MWDWLLILVADVAAEVGSRSRFGEWFEPGHVFVLFPDASELPPDLIRREELGWGGRSYLWSRFSCWK